MSEDDPLAASRRLVDPALDRLLPQAHGPAAKVAEAMRYAVLSGGKRLRPTIVLVCCEVCGGNPDDAVEPAAALEMIHAYSLVHDDLPAMDDDDLRRGRPTVHRVYGDATAILAGDALLTLAFEILATYPRGEDLASVRGESVATVARAAGIAGMVGGQQADLSAEGSAVDAAELEWIHRRKTGALLSACAELGGTYARAPEPIRRALAVWGELVGLAFQVIDDVLDQTGTAEALGKTPGKDRTSRKATYPALLGVETSRRHARELVDRAMDGLSAAGLRDDRIDALARLAVLRSS